ncbi:MAG: tetratricopeptide repeat protein [Betaproteobacteria bacterium]|nr:tetratricopeptide repeat protein [Betaproteobacteria bacterium]
MGFSIRKFFTRDAPKPSAWPAPAPPGDRHRAQEFIDRGIAEENAGAAGQALQCYRKAIEADAGFAPAHMNLGIALQAAQDLPGAIASYQSAIALDPGYAVAHYNLGLARLMHGEHAQAENDFRAALEWRADFPEAWVGLADALEALGRDNEALAALDAAIGQRGHFVGALFNASVLLRRIGQLDEARARLREIDLVGLFSARRHAEAEALARRMTEIWPEYGLGWKVLGSTLAAGRRFEDALPVFQKTLMLLPADAETHNNLGVALQALGRTFEAEASFRRAVEFRPEFHEAHNHLANTLRGLGRHSEAQASYRRALKLKPDYPVAHNDLGNALKDQGRLSEAQACYRDALQYQPDFPEAHNNLGAVLQDLERLSEAEASYRRALELKPEFDGAHNNLANLLLELRRPSEAELSCRRAIELAPNFRQAHTNLGNALTCLGRWTEAEASFRRALEIDPESHEAHSNFAAALMDHGQLVEAEASCRRALVIKSDYHAAHNNLGNVLRELGQLTEAQACYRRALELKPEYPEAHNNLGNALHTLGRISEAKSSYARALELRPDYHEAHSNLIFTLDLLEQCTIPEQQAERRRWYERHGQAHAGAIRPHDNPPDPERKLRVGYVSADFRRHSAYYGFSPIILRHDRNAFEVVCYSGVKLEDDATALLRQAAHGWRSTLGVSDAALAEQIRRDRIDILVDLSGHSAGNRLPVFARKPAPIQVTGWGFAGGTGLATMDYYASDAVVVPPQERALYAEEVIYLPCGACYEAPGYAPAVSGLPGLQGKAFAFGCINRIEKISERVIGLWGRILAQLPEARLLIKGGGLNDLAHRQQFMRRLRDAGIGPERLSLMGTTPHPEHLKIYHEVDLGLDPYPHGGGISTAEALWMGVPVVALAGASITSRITPSILQVLQMPEWIAHSDEEYVRIAVNAARDLPGLARLRAQLRSRLAASALGDVQGYTRHAEAAFPGIFASSTSSICSLSR